MTAAEVAVGGVDLVNGAHLPSLVVYVTLAVQLSDLAAEKPPRPDGCLSLRARKHKHGLEQMVLQCVLM